MKKLKKRAFYNLVSSLGLDVLPKSTKFDYINCPGTSERLISRSGLKEFYFDYFPGFKFTSLTAHIKIYIDDSFLEYKDFYYVYYLVNDKFVLDHSLCSFHKYVWNDVDCKYDLV